MEQEPEERTPKNNEHGISAPPCIDEVIIEEREENKKGGHTGPMNECMIIDDDSDPPENIEGVSRALGTPVLKRRRIDPRFGQPGPSGSADVRHTPSSPYDQCSSPFFHSRYCKSVFASNARVERSSQSRNSAASSARASTSASLSADTPSYSRPSTSASLPPDTPSNSRPSTSASSGSIYCSRNNCCYCARLSTSSVNGTTRNSGSRTSGPSQWEGAYSPPYTPPVQRESPRQYYPDSTSTLSPEPPINHRAVGYILPEIVADPVPNISDPYMRLLQPSAAMNTYKITPDGSWVYSHTSIYYK